MPSISRIRLTNVVFENGGKRFNDDTFQFDGHNGAILLENGGGKTVFVQTALQVVLPHYNMEERKIRDTLSLEGSPCHVAIEWILNERPRRYLTTAITLFLANGQLDSYKYTYEYDVGDDHSLVKMPFVISGQEGRMRPASKGEIADYYQGMAARNMNARFFRTIKDYHYYIEENYNIIPSEWRSIGLINSAEGGVENYFENCKTTNQLVNRLLIPVVEEAISEGVKKDFADIFEEQRERFKKHKQLRDRIKESQLIAHKIQGYVETFANYHQGEMAYLEKKQYAKAVYLYMQQEGKELAGKIKDNKGEAAEITKSIHELEKKEASYELAVLNKELKDYQEELKLAETIFYEVKNEYDENYARYHSLKVAKSKQVLRETEERIENNQAQLKRLAEDADLAKIRQELAENSGALKDYYVKEEKAILDQIDEIGIKSCEQQEKLKLIQKHLEELKRARENKISTYNQKKGQMGEIAKELKRIEKSIFGLDPSRDKYPQLQNWMEKVNELEKANINNSTKINKLKLEQSALDEAKKADQRNFVELANQKTKLDEKLLTVKEKHDALLIELKMLNDSWYHYDSLYKRERTIIPHLTGQIDILHREKEELLLAERRLGRFKDDYGHNQLFTVEPLMEKWVHQWQEKFMVIESGTQYLQRASRELGKDEAELVKIYPYWSLAVIVEESEIAQLEEEIKMRVEQITYPILILGQGEALDIIQAKTPAEERIILPPHWQENVHQDHFEKWQGEMRAKVRELVASRQEKEEEIQNFTQALRDVNFFLREHPYEDFKGLETNLALVQENMAELTLQINKKDELLVAIQEDWEHCLEKVHNFKDEIHHLNQQIQLLQLFMAKEKEIEQITTAINQINESIIELDKGLALANHQLENNKKELKALDEENRHFQGKLKDLRKEVLYIEVQAVAPKHNQRSKNALEEERNNLKELLYEQEGNYKYIEQAIKGDEERKRDLTREIERARKESNVLIDETIDYHLYGEEQLEYLLEVLDNLQPIKGEKEDALKEAGDKYKAQLTRVNLLQEQFFQKYDQIVLFEQPLDQEKESLKQERKILKERKTENEKLELGLSVEERNLSQGIRLLEVENGKYEYMMAEIQPISLKPEFYRDFPYQRLEFINDLSATLKDLKASTSSVFLRLTEHKNEFIYFCEEEIKDPRLREKTVIGVRQKNSYEETLEWQNRMKKSIQHTIMVAEDDMREHDRDLEQFVNHLFTYLRTITDELNMIPKKTRIKVDNRWKEVYVFNIPEWNEEEGKEKIRKHIDWMLQELEKQEFKDGEGGENMAVVRKEVERWLDVKQLLPLVFKNNVIKISCRKVTNDNKISSSLTTWERSNSWSGGEKWSKNMTLFLGILNYVAEKRQGLLASTKTNRTVIVDNPFGKASSDHILDPVFYISEKLGFQMIALTAHSEGSFIRNYFPVVYSCRLREATNNKSMIIDKEKQIHHAFFRDHNPDSLLRLEEQEQLSLF